MKTFLSIFFITSFVHVVSSVTMLGSFNSENMSILDPGVEYSQRDYPSSSFRSFTYKISKCVDHEGKKAADVTLTYTMKEENSDDSKYVFTRRIGETDCNKVSQRISDYISQRSTVYQKAFYGVILDDRSVSPYCFRYVGYSFIFDKTKLPIGQEGYEITAIANCPTR